MDTATQAYYRAKAKYDQAEANLDEVVKETDSVIEAQDYAIAAQELMVKRLKRKIKWINSAIYLFALPMSIASFCRANLYIGIVISICILIWMVLKHGARG